MPITLEVNYSKKLGLPGFSSHQCSLTIRIELSDLKQVETESNRLYTLLQGCVDRDLQQTGYLPANSHGANGQGNGHTNGHGTNGGNGYRSNGNGHGLRHGQADVWSCTDKQKGLILGIVADHQLDKHAIEELAQQRFGKPVRQLNKMEASGLIDELLETHGGQNGNGRSRTNGRHHTPARTA
jgi:hypothetical protein